jgi:hypothetical protein
LELQFDDKHSMRTSAGRAVFSLPEAEISPAALVFFSELLQELESAERQSRVISHALKVRSRSRDRSFSTQSVPIFPSKSISTLSVEEIRGTTMESIKIKVRRR